MDNSSRSKCILVVDDEEELRGMMERVLTDAGYKVLEAPDGREALQLITDARHPIDLILTDIVMPWMGGEELIGSVRKAGYDTPIICTSGFVRRAEEMSDSLPNALLLKPFTPRQLLIAVDSVLAHPPEKR